MTSEAYRRNYAEIEWKPLKKTPAKEARKGPAFYIIPDLEPYKSPITDEVIRSRSHHRVHLRDHGVIEVGNERPRKSRPEKLPDAREDIKVAMDMVRSGYRPRPQYDGEL